MGERRKSVGNVLFCAGSTESNWKDEIHLCKVNLDCMHVSDGVSTAEATLSLAMPTGPDDELQR